MRTDEQKNESIKGSRRDLFKGVGVLISGAAISAAFGSKKPVFADAAGGDTAILTEISIWLKTTWATQLLPFINMVKEWYDTIKGWIKSWNDFVTTFNRGIQLADDVHGFLIRREDNWFYQTYVNLKKSIDPMMHTDGPILKNKLHYLEPNLIKNIDSMMGEIQSLVTRAEHAANAYDKLNHSGSNDTFRQTKSGRLAIRATNDQAKYSDCIAQLSAIRQSVEITKNSLSQLSEKNKSPENNAKVYSDLIAPKMLDALLLQCSIQSEIYAKLNDIFLVTVQSDPVISSHEKVVTQEDMKQYIEKLRDQGTVNNKGERNGYLF